MPYFEHCGAKLHYEEKGVGKALIFLHGAAWDLRQWDRQMEVFSSHYRPRPREVHSASGGGFSFDLLAGCSGADESFADRKGRSLRPFYGRPRGASDSDLCAGKSRRTYFDRYALYQPI